MIAAGKKCGPRRRAQRRGVKVVVTKAARCHPIQSRGWNRPAESAGCTEARVVGQDQKNVRCARGRCDRFGKVRLRFTGLAANDAFKRRCGGREQSRASGSRRCALCECSNRQSNATANDGSDSDHLKKVPLETHESLLPILRLPARLSKKGGIVTSWTLVQH